MCEYCKDWKTKETAYQDTIYMSLKIAGFGNNPILLVDNKHVGNCKECQNRIDIRNSFKINYCPNCGKRLNTLLE